MMGMLLCLDRMQRLVFTLGAIFGTSAATGAEILGISPQNYRQILSRARRELASFMNEKCGLMQPGNPCRCAKKTCAAIAAGYIDPEHLQFAERHVTRVRQVATRCVESVDDLLEEKAVELFRDHPFLRPPDFASAVLALFGCPSG
jgi:hypothetical protein